MSDRLGRVVSDLSHSNSRGAAGLHRQSTTASNNDDRGNVGGRTRQRLALLFSGVVARTRSESSGETGSGPRAKNRKQQQQQQQTTTNGGGPGARRRGLDIVLALRKYMSMVEQLFASYSGGSSARRDGDARRRRRPHTFTYARGGGGGGGGASSSSSSRRHKGRLSSAPASLRGSPSNSGHLAVGESVTGTKASTPSEVSTMEELHSAIQAAIAHCKSSAGVGGEPPPQPPRA